MDDYLKKLTEDYNDDPEIAPLVYRVDVLDREIDELTGTTSEVKHLKHLKCSEKYDVQSKIGNLVLFRKTNNRDEKYKWIHLGLTAIAVICAIISAVI